MSNANVSRKSSRLGAEMRSGYSATNLISQESLQKSSYDQHHEGDEDQPVQPYTKSILNMFSDANSKPKSKIQDALFFTKEVKDYLAQISNGEEAISFFAKYGNSTPIKFINCVRTPTPKEVFRPYDLTALPHKELGDINLNEYYTISAHGVVHVYTDKRKKRKLLRLF